MIVSTEQGKDSHYQLGFTLPDLTRPQTYTNYTIHTKILTIFEVCFTSSHLAACCILSFTNGLDGKIQ